MSFIMKVESERLRITSPLNSGVQTSPRPGLSFFCEGKQVGYRETGNVDILDNPNGSPPNAGRFFYRTVPLPLSLTQGKPELHFEIRSSGRIWPYGPAWQKYQYPMSEPSPAIYRVYTHTESCFEPPKDETQGDFPHNPPVRSAPGEEVLQTLKTRVSDSISGTLASTKPLDQWNLNFLARAYHVKWSPAYQNDAVVQRVIQDTDAYYRRFKTDPKVSQEDPLSGSNAGWTGLGPLAQAVFLLKDPLQSSLDQAIDGVPRRAAWSEMFQASRSWLEQHRRSYTNQSLIVDRDLYLSNRGIEAIDLSHAEPEDKVRRYLYEALAIQPWLGSETDKGPEKPLGDDYWELTPKGLTKELGFVGYYGEVISGATEMYLDTADPDKPGSGDEKIREQILKMGHARSYFRYPAVDDEGNRAMRIEAVVGWRDPDHYPGRIDYGEDPGRDCASLDLASATLDQSQVGYAQQMFDDNQFFIGIAQALKQLGSYETKIGALAVPDQYELIKAQAPRPERLPMTPGQPDCVFTDEQDGVVAIKRGDEILYVSLYWRAYYAINFLARVHNITTHFDRIAVVHEDIQFEPSGLDYIRPNWPDAGGSAGGVRYPGNLVLAEAGEKLPIAKIPDGIVYKPNAENPYAGRGSFYRLLYGNYLIGMNASKDKTYDLEIPPGVTQAIDLVAQKSVVLSGSVRVGPNSTTVLYLGATGSSQN